MSNLEHPPFKLETLPMLSFERMIADECFNALEHHSRMQDYPLDDTTWAFVPESDRCDLPDDDAHPIKI